MGTISVAYKDIYQIVDGTLEKGLAYVGSYLKNIIGRHIVITDDSGCIHYPRISPSIKYIEDFFVTLPNLYPNDYLYSETEKCLYYRIICSDSSAYIIVKDLPSFQIPLTLTTLKQAKLAVKCYFTQVKPTHNTVIFEQEMYEYLFGQNTTNLIDILRLGNYRWPSDCICYVDVMEISDIKSNEQWNAIEHFSREFLKRVAPESFMVSRPLRIAHVFQAGPKMVKIESYKIALEKRFQINVSFGRSQPHSLKNLRRSCDEARLALHYPHVMGTMDDIQYFSDLGIFTPLFSQELNTVKMFCRNTLEPIFDYDTKNKNSLFPTLAKLVNSNFNLKETAKKLFIHINTLYYRIKRIEQLLNVDMSLMNTRVNLFTALKSYALLCKSGLWDGAPELTGEHARSMIDDLSTCATKKV